MIGRIQGRLLEKLPTEVVIDVSGVGYEISVPLSTFYQLDEVDDPVTLHIQMIVREDAQLLYGFASRRERELFRSLIKVNGVGPKLAITILSGVDVIRFGQCVRDNDVKSLIALPGVGKKTAERLIVEMKDRLPDTGGDVESLMHPNTVNRADAESALTGLGFRLQDASQALDRIEDAEVSVEELIKQALKNLT